MISFTDNEILKIRQKAAENPEFIENIMQSTADVRRKLYIQETGIGTWPHYYVCPLCAVRLTFNYDDNTHHVCPSCGKILSGEPYDGAWWAIVASRNDDACFKLALMHMVTGDATALSVAQNILLGYAKYYPSYEVHGGIPYNKPGKVGSQVLNDTCFLNNLVRAYDIIKDTFSPEQQKCIETNLLLEGALFIKSQGTPQIHNHEVANCSTIGMVGILLGREDLIEYAVNAKYGLKYQLDNAVLADGLWFEVALGYHFYALLWFMRYEKFARHTKHSLFADEHYREILHTMLVYALKIMNKENKIVFMNDSGGGFGGQTELYEYAYSYFKDSETLLALHLALSTSERTGIDSLAYGTYPLPSKPDHEYKNYYDTKGSNFAVIHGSDERLLLFKATPYGGEHDHYDRLALSFSAFGKDICSDLGTAVGYGSPLHYAYFKNTATHNTVVIDGENTAPAPTMVNAYTEYAPDDILLDAETDWTLDYEMPDTHTIKQWSDECCKGVKMRRIIRWYDKFFVDVFIVDSPNDFTKDWTWHVRGMLKNPHRDAQPLPSLNTKNPQHLFHNAFSVDSQDEVVKSIYDCGGFELDIYSECRNCNLIYALGPDNPSTSDISYLLERTNAKKAVYINVIEAHRPGEGIINSVEVESDNGVCVKVHTDSGIKIVKI